MGVFGDGHSITEPRSGSDPVLWPFHSIRQTVEALNRTIVNSIQTRSLPLLGSVIDTHYQELSLLRFKLKPYFYLVELAYLFEERNDSRGSLAAAIAFPHHDRIGNEIV